MRGPLLERSQVEDLNREQKQSEKVLRSSGMRRSKASVPVVRLEGPLLPIITIQDCADTSHPLGFGHRWHILK
eukprot:11400488-Karenia_brevis.AAC.1